MTLYILQHARRLASPDEAARLFAALGEKRVSLNGLRTRDAAQIARCVSALDSRYPRKISFEGGTLTAPARQALQGLALAAYEYLDLRTQNAELRCWPTLYSWVHAQADRDALARILGVPIPDAPITLGEVRHTWFGDGRTYPSYIETKTPGAAWKIFDALSLDPIVRGFVSESKPAAGPSLQRFLIASGAEISVDLELSVDAAASLTAHAEGADCRWQANGVMIHLPDGRIEGGLTSSNYTEQNQAKWHARIDQGLRKAGLT